MSVERYRVRFDWSIFLLVAALLFTSAPLFAQDYTIEEYNAYQKAVDDGEDAMIGFLQEHPQSSLNEYVVGAYLQKLNEYREKQQWDKAYQEGKKFLDKVDTKIVPEDNQNRSLILTMTTWAAYNSKHYAEAAAYGSQVYATKPDTENLVMIMARSYLYAGDLPNTVKYGEKYCATVEPENCFDILPTLMRYYADQKSWSTASKYAKQTIDALAKAPKPATVEESEWRKYTNEQKSVAYSIIGRSAFENKNWANSEKSYSSALNLAPNSDLRAEAHYYIGMSRWNQKQIDPAMDAFAKGVAQGNTPYRATCQKQLEKLYRATHNGSLAGLDELLERARSG
jgi:tetratricopeptide (TPR) repeat protein